MPKKYKYKIGDWVEFKKHIKVRSTEGERYAFEIGNFKPIKGQVCGAITRFLGDIKTHEWDYHSNDAFLVIKKSVILYQIRSGMTNIPYEVKEEDIRKLDALDLHAAGINKLPWRYAPYSIYDKKAASKQAQSQRRDNKGRFIRHMLKTVER